MITLNQSGLYGWFEGEMPLIGLGISVFDLELLVLFGEVLEPLGDMACWRKHITVGRFGVFILLFSFKFAFSASCLWLKM